MSTVGPTFSRAVRYSRISAVCRCSLRVYRKNSSVIGHIFGTQVVGIIRFVPHRLILCAGCRCPARQLDLVADLVRTAQPIVDCRCSGPAVRQLRRGFAVRPHLFRSQPGLLEVDGAKRATRNGHWVRWMTTTLAFYASVY